LTSGLVSSVAGHASEFDYYTRGIEETAALKRLRLSHPIRETEGEYVAG
jgi:hypothetical protein